MNSIQNKMTTENFQEDQLSNISNQIFKPIY